MSEPPLNQELVFWHMMSDAKEALFVVSVSGGLF